MRVKGGMWILVAVLGFGGGCSSVPKHQRTLSQILVSPLRVRRPSGPGAHPKAGPGGEDYVAKPLPDAHYDCQEPKALVEGLDLGAVHECLRQLDQDGKVVQVRYRLKREAVPEFYLEDPEAETLPACLRSSLPVIPVPREMFYLVSEDGRMQCYSSRVDVEANQFLDWKLPTDKLSLVLDFPLDDLPKNREELIRLLNAWSLTPFFEKDRVLHAMPVTRPICETCFNNKLLFDSPEVPPPTWP